MKVLKKKVLKCLRVGKFVDIGILIPATIPQVIVEVVNVVDIGLKIPATITQVIAKVMDVGQVLPATLPIIITEYMLIDVDIGHKRPATLPLAIGEHEFMLKGEVDIGLIPATITPIAMVNV